MSESETAQARQAALLLHGLAPQAARQVMDRLTPAERGRLQPLLDELVAMGLETPPAGAGSAPGRGETLGGVRGATALQRAAALDAAVVERGLRPCAPTTVARLLQAATWPWREPVLERMPPLRRAAVRAAIARPVATTVAPALLALWCERLCDQAQGPRPHDVGAVPLQGLRARLSSWSALEVRGRRLFEWKR